MTSNSKHMTDKKHITQKKTKGDFNKVVLQMALRHECSPVNLLHIFRTSFPKNTPGRLPLKVENADLINPY